jgi:hypothetical protein
LYAIISFAGYLPYQRKALTVYSRKAGMQDFPGSGFYAFYGMEN